MRLRRHQEEVDRLCRAIAAGGAGSLTDILAAVTPGGGKSALPVIAAARLLGMVPPGHARPLTERVCWVVPRDTLRRQAEEAFVDPAWRAFLGHGHAVRAADNAPDPCRGLAGYVTTYQSVAAAPELHLAAFQRHRFLLCVDELHHLPGLSELDAAAGLARVDPHAPGWALVGYDRRAALAERAIIPIRFGALDGEAEWRLGRERCSAPSFAAAGEEDRLRPMLFTVLRTGFAEAMLRRGLAD